MRKNIFKKIFFSLLCFFILGFSFLIPGISAKSSFSLLSDDSVYNGDVYYYNDSSFYEENSFYYCAIVEFITPTRFEEDIFIEQVFCNSSSFDFYFYYLLTYEMSISLYDSCFSYGIVPFLMMSSINYSQFENLSKSLCYSDSYSNFSDVEVYNVSTVTNHYYLLFSSMLPFYLKFYSISNTSFYPNGFDDIIDNSGSYYGGDVVITYFHPFTYPIPSVLPPPSNNLFSLVKNRLLPLFYDQTYNDIQVAPWGLTLGDIIAVMFILVYAFIILFVLILLPFRLLKQVLPRSVRTRKGK